MSADVRVTVLIADASRAQDAETACRALRGAASNARISVHAIALETEFAERKAYRARGVAAAFRSDVVLYLADESPKARAALIVLRERAGFGVRLGEPEFARVWFSANRRRSLYVLGAFPGAFGSLALALELGFGDPSAAKRLREHGEAAELIAV